jgi:hypothetical protein
MLEKAYTVLLAQRDREEGDVARDAKKEVLGSKLAML